MKLHEVFEHTEKPYFRKMKVESGYLYNFYDEQLDEYHEEWIFIPDSKKKTLPLPI